MSLTESQINDIRTILESKDISDTKYAFNNQTWWDFRHFENKGKMPNLSIVFEPDGIYIHQTNPNLWGDLDELKKYISDNRIEHKTVDYQEE